MRAQGSGVPVDPVPSPIDEVISGAYRGIDPYPGLRALGAEHDTARSESGILYVTSYALCTSLLRSGMLAKGGRHGSAAFAGSAGQTDDASGPREPGWLTTIDDPDHRRIRSVISRAFDYRSVQSIRERADTIAHDLIRALSVRRPVEIMSEFALTYPTRVIDSLVGIDMSAFGSFVRFAHDHQRDREPRADRAERAAAIAGREQIYAYVDEVLTAGPRAVGVASALLTAEAEGIVSRRESSTLIGQLYLAGFHSPGYLLGTALCQLVESPELLARLRTTPDLIPAFVNEALRYDTPLMTATYRTIQPMVIDGAELAEGAPVSFLLGAANHDARVFVSPEQFRVERAESAVLSFSSGIHSCIAGHLTRMMAASAVTGFVSMFRAVEYAQSTPPHAATFNLRGRPRIDLRLSI